MRIHYATCTTSETENPSSIATNRWKDSVDAAKAVNNISQTYKFLVTRT